MLDGKTPYEVHDFRTGVDLLPAIAVLERAPGAVLALGLGYMTALFELVEDTDYQLEAATGSVTVQSAAGMVVFTPLQKDSELLDRLDIPFEAIAGACGDQ